MTTRSTASRSGPLATLIAALALAITPLGCASSPTGTPAPTATKSVSLRSDVLPVFATNCSTTGTCHGSPTGIEVFLAGGPSNATAIRNGLVGVPTAELPSMPFVTAGNATKSYLMHKLDGDQAQFAAQCTGGDCGAQMPREATPLDQATRDAIRSWITEGALDN